MPDVPRLTRWPAWPLALLVVAASALSAPADDFRVYPYLQHPAPDAMTVLWFSDSAEPGMLRFAPVDGGARVEERTSQPVVAASLAYPPWEEQTFFGGAAPPAPYRHRLRLAGLRPDTRYAYSVRQGATTFADTFHTAPTVRRPVRLTFFSDSETEPESTGKPTAWADPSGAEASRVYLLDQTTGFANNLEVILGRRPDLLAVSGDLVESGGEQRDWDEFWQHLSGSRGHLASRVPLVAVPGNHEYYEGPGMDGYAQPGSERAIARYLTYFEEPANGSAEPADEGRYWRLDYGPVTLVGLDVTNGTPHQSPGDTNYYLLGQGDEGGGGSPGFAPGTRQYAWLEAQLQDAQARSAFTFVLFHHVSHSVGPHGWPPGPVSGGGLDPQSGVPVRALAPLFLRYGVDALIAGHDEIWERSELAGTQVRPDGTRIPHVLQVWDVGTAGDGLRGPESGLTNEAQRYLVHTDVPEVWRDGILVEGGKHYGHLEVDVLPADDGTWQAVLTPAYAFPLFAAGGPYLGYERRVYEDVVTLAGRQASTAVGDTGTGSVPSAVTLWAPWPNPFNATVLLRYDLPRRAAVEVDVYDALGQRVRRLVDGQQPAGHHRVEWNATDAEGALVASGVYVVRLRTGSYSDSATVVLAR
ncbi:MAG: FlgD immunoglobulin-like domain containing protein [Candidatus Latescibacterota bacterium]